MEVPSPISSPDELSSEPSSVIAAVDLGSNSFHMVVAQDQHGQLKVVDKMREMVRLGAGLNASGKLSEESKTRAIECLQRFGQRLQEMHADSVRVVGTNTLRIAKKSNEFIQRAEEALGHPIQIISGVEEARLIYHIGGGSTELIIGNKGDPLLMESVQMGCVVISEKYFSDGNLEKKKFKKALVAAKLQLQPIISKLKELGWQHVVGTAGTIRTISALMREFELSEQGISYKGINALITKLQEAEHIDNVSFSALAKERKPVFAGGLVVLKAIFEELDIKTMNISAGGLREGLLFDLLGRIHHQDTRDRTVYSLMRRYHVDFEHATNIKATAKKLLDKVSKVWKVENEIAYQFLIWAADLHEIGLDISHSKYHRHGAYLLNNSDLMGFSWNEQCLLACLVGNHRRKINLDLIEQLPSRWQEQAVFMIVILRMAILINRDRAPKQLPKIKVQDKGGDLIIRFDQEWLDERPLTVAELEQEQNYLKPLKRNISIINL